MSANKVELQCGLENVDWERFHSYTRRIRLLAWDDVKGTMTLDDDIFGQLAIHRPQNQTLLPNLTRIVWGASSEVTLYQVLAFANPSLKILELRAENCTKVNMGVVLKGVCNRSILLSEFGLALPYRSHLDEYLPNFLRLQPRLRSAAFPLDFGTKLVVKAVEELVDLESINLTTTQQTAISEDQHWQFKAGCYVKLARLAFARPSLAHAAEVFHDHDLAQISSVTLVAPNVWAGNTELTAFLSALVASCSQLQSISLFLFCGSVLNHRAGADQRLAFTALNPLLQCRGLKDLEISHDRAMLIKEEDIIKLSQAWPQLERLHLNVDPFEPSLSWCNGVPITFLSVFARWAPPTLYHLGLTFDTTESDISNHIGFSTFPSLDTLAVGNSIILARQKAAVASFLAGMCKAGILIDTETGYYRKPYEGLQTAERLGSQNVWREVVRQIRRIHMFQRPWRYELELAQRMGPPGLRGALHTYTRGR
ncbi:hypothetical protein FRB96_001785 [Tulasnella sp. 330]|nr:hypothetical protein FRB96_001785 [Tulasnella sp. 330]KAG8874358.1 hypothetical protein FRB97_005964 [Tulasnella sp. 331]KAG8886984.1 hypothetical protein FRB98_000708 [Tulasnella sp. 332]